MKTAHSFCSLAFVLAPLLAAEPTGLKLPELTIEFSPYVVAFHVDQPGPDFLGVVLVSLTPNLQHYLVGLPPLLDQSIVLGWGLSQDGRFTSKQSEFTFPPGIMFYVQGVTIGDGGILSSDVGSFVLDATGIPGK